MLQTIMPVSLVDWLCGTSVSSFILLWRYCQMVLFPHSWSVACVTACCVKLLLLGNSRVAKGFHLFYTNRLQWAVYHLQWCNLWVIAGSRWGTGRVHSCSSCWEVGL